MTVPVQTAPSFVAGKSAVLFEGVDPIFVNRPYDVSPDGKRFIFFKGTVRIKDAIRRRPELVRGTETPPAGEGALALARRHARALRREAETFVERVRRRLGACSARVWFIRPCQPFPVNRYASRTS